MCVLSTHLLSEIERPHDPLASPPSHDFFFYLWCYRMCYTIGSSHIPMLSLLLYLTNTSSFLEPLGGSRLWQPKHFGTSWRSPPRPIRMDGLRGWSQLRLRSGSLHPQDPWRLLWYRSGRLPREAPRVGHHGGGPAVPEGEGRCWRRLHCHPVVL